MRRNKGLRPWLVEPGFVFSAETAEEAEAMYERWHSSLMSVPWNEAILPIVTALNDEGAESPQVVAPEVPSVERTLIRMLRLLISEEIDASKGGEG